MVMEKPDQSQKTGQANPHHKREGPDLYLQHTSNHLTYLLMNNGSMANGYADL
jgi:hypothetical protein